MGHTGTGPYGSSNDRRDPFGIPTEVHIAVRPDFINEANRAIWDMRDILTQLNDEEKKYLQMNSPIYRELVEMIRTPPPKPELRSFQDSMNQYINDNLRQ